MCRFLCVRYVCVDHKSRNDGNMTPGDLETHTGWIRCGFYGQRNIKWPFGDSFYMFLLSTSHLWVLIILYIYISLIIGDCLLSGCIIIFCLPHSNISLSTNLSWSFWKGCILHRVQVNATGAVSTVTSRVKRTVRQLSALWEGMSTTRRQVPWWQFGLEGGTNMNMRSSGGQDDGCTCWFCPVSPAIFGCGAWSNVMQTDVIFQSS